MDNICNPLFLEMAERAPREGDLASFAIDEARRRDARRRLADPRRSDAGRNGGGLEDGAGTGRHGGDQFVIVAACDCNGEQRRIGGDRRGRGGRQRQPREFDPRT